MRKETIKTLKSLARKVIRLKPTRVHRDKNVYSRKDKHKLDAKEDV